MDGGAPSPTELARCIKLAMALHNPVLLDWFRKLISRASLYAAALDDERTTPAATTSTCG